LRIIFLGTPEFSVASLKAIVEANYNVVAVITAPDKPAGRGLHMQESAVKQYAKSQHIPVLQPLKLKDPVFIEELKSYNADLQIVIAFRMLPEIVWNMPKLGTINLHASLLPDYRGAAPINWAIINGEKETGVCTFFLKHEIDTGDMIMSKKVPISNDMDAGELHDILMKTGADVITNTIKSIENKSYQLIPQGNNSNKIAPKIFTEQCKINWNEKGEDIYNLIRGMSPHPGAFTELDGKIFKIYKSEFIEDAYIKTEAGKIDTNGKNYMRFACLNGWIDVKSVQLAGKRRISINEFLIGYHKDK
jgi:methionyl-tRNA formyltransferase